MASNEEARLEFLKHKREEWEAFFERPEWKEVTRRGQELVDVLTNKLYNMEVKDINGVIEMLDLRSRIKGVLVQGMVASEVLTEINDEIEKLTGG